MADNAIVKKDHLEFAKKTYFMAGAEDVNIASYGLKLRDSTTKKPFHTKGDHVEPHGTLSLKNAKAQQVAGIELDKATKVDVNGSAKGTVRIAHVPLKLTVAASGEHKVGTTDAVKLLKIQLDMKVIAEQLNNDREAVVDMMQAGSNARVVHEVFVVVSAQLDSALQDNGSISLSGGMSSAPTVNASVSLDTTVSKEKSMTLTLAKDQVFAYSTLKFSPAFVKTHYDKDNKLLPKSAETIQKNPPKLTAGDFTEDQFGK
jgi:hypothetical protein